MRVTISNEYSRELELSPGGPGFTGDTCDFELRQPLPQGMEHHAGRSSRISGRRKGSRINQPTNAKTHGWAIIAGLSELPLIRIRQA